MRVPYSGREVVRAGDVCRGFGFAPIAAEHAENQECFHLQRNVSELVSALKGGACARESRRELVSRPVSRAPGKPDLDEYLQRRAWCYFEQGILEKWSREIVRLELGQQDENLSVQRTSLGRGQ